ncbi:ABC transporter ATP-binding protein [Actinotalea sp. M2MS4P-6]|uniref:ABC transporter ATP-binding protein n=1 Tax=Actinotalea sp. M2MS4P-6 TaxID=2983762 RepID=UPI0021E3D9FC|nr:ABC transporter ATP-binding protein [Actinotalea sp. M2MS4P-6]MCV2393590.1 ABC transporter ATP-binding protein [Actinotalea sp. M2MS4P-6]
MSWGLHEVTVRFGHQVALDQVSVEAVPGHVIGLVGGDGAGKTTVLRTLVGEVVPASGTVRAPDAHRIGYLPASAGSWAELSVQENVDFVGQSFGLSRTDLGERADRLLERAGLDAARNRLARQLSGGMRRKLGFCLAMLAGPDLLVLDEPSTGVDPVSRVELWRMVSEAAAAGTAVVMSTTYLDEAERCGELVVLDEGHTLVSGPPADALQAMVGTVVRVATPTHPERAWRRGREHHEWFPPGEQPVGTPVTPDLEDVVIAASLARRVEA